MNAATPNLQVLAKRLDRLEARVAIAELLACYGWALDEWNEDDMRLVIANDVIARHDAVAPPFKGIEVAENWFDPRILTDIYADSPMSGQQL